MQTWEAITSRRNVRSFADRPIPAADLDRILEAGRRSPSSQNWQPWDFVLVTDRQQLGELAKVWRGAGHVAHSAATIVVVGPAADNAFRRAQLDLGQATMPMMLAAADLGIGSSHAGDRGPAAGPRAARHPGRPGLGAADLARLPGRPSADPHQESRPAAVRRRRAPRALVARLQPPLLRKPATAEVNKPGSGRAQG